MKLNSFKFQDGKVFWLPEYPEKPIYETWRQGDPDPYSIIRNHNILLEDKYNKSVAQSLASAIEVAQEDVEEIKDKIWWGLEDMIPENNTNGKVYGAECEIRIIHQCLASQIWVNVEKPIYDGWLICYPQNVRQVARLKPKDEIFPAANSYDMKEEDL